MTKKSKSWYRLDNAGKLYSLTITSITTTLFRVSATMTSTIDPVLLQKAMATTLTRFPFLKVQLKRGFFWYYFEETEEVPKVEEESYYPCMSLPIKKKRIFPYRVLYYNRRIAVEFSHSMTDGTGALKFLNELLSQYVFLKENLPIHHATVNQRQIEVETEDSFHKYYEKSVPSSFIPLEESYKLPVKVNKRGQYYIVTGIIEVLSLKQKAREYNVSISVFLISVYIEVLINIQKQTTNNKRPIVINVPVNLRSIFPSETMRNFFVSITPSIDPRLGEYTFTEIIEEVELEFKRTLNPKKIKPVISRNVSSEKILLLRVIPLAIKDIIARFVYSYYGEKQYTSGLSNLGKAEVSEELEPFIERVECYPPPSIGNKVKVVVISHKRYTYISFGNLSTNRIVEREFFRKLRKMGISVKIETNKEWD